MKITFEKVVFVVLVASFKLAILFGFIDVLLILAADPPIHGCFLAMVGACAFSAVVYGGMIFTGSIDLKPK
jgi:hypothetical protein